MKLYSCALMDHMVSVPALHFAAWSRAQRSVLECMSKQYKTVSLSNEQRIAREAVCRRHIQYIDDVLELLPQMVTPGRADNNIRKFNQLELENIARRYCLCASLRLLQ